MCTSPLIMYKLRGKTKNGKTNYTFSRKEALEVGFDIGYFMPCGKCLSCRFSHAREFAFRSTKETAYHQSNIFFTLTYRPEDLRSNSLVYSHLQDFWKRLRADIDYSPAKYIQTSDNSHISYMACGEYGSIFKRPHFHAIVYNLDFADRYPFYYQQSNVANFGYWIYRSSTLERLWPFGFSSIGEVNFAVSQYVAGYVMKKQYGKDFKELYGDCEPEKVFISQKPAIGFQWLQDNHTNMLYKGYCFARNRDKCFKMHIPRYFLKKSSELWPEEYDAYLERRPLPYTTADELRAHLNGEETKFDNAFSNMLYQEELNERIERDLSDSYYTLSDNFDKLLDYQEL